MTGKKMLAIFLAVLPAAFVFMAPAIHGFVSSKIWTAAAKTWTTRDLAELSKTKTMAAAVNEMASAVRQSGAKKEQLNLKE